MTTLDVPASEPQFVMEDERERAARISREAALLAPARMEVEAGRKVTWAALRDASDALMGVPIADRKATTSRVTASWLFRAIASSTLSSWTQDTAKRLVA